MTIEVEMTPRLLATAKGGVYLVVADTAAWSLNMLLVPLMIR